MKDCSATNVLAFLVTASIAVAPLARGVETGQGDEKRPDDAKQTAPLFESHIQPILKASCVRCHNERTHKSGLDLGSAAGLLAGGESGAVVTAGKPDESLLVQMIADGDMPPEPAARLTAEQIELIRRWIADGARFSDPHAGQKQITQHDVIPILQLRCAACHGARRREADLDLRTKASLLKGGKSGPAVVPGRPDESLIVKRIAAEEMPPRRELVKASVKPMPANELARLRTWIQLGLPESPVGPDVATTTPDELVSDDDRTFWSFQKPVTPAIPSVHQDRSRITSFNPEPKSSKATAYGGSRERDAAAAAAVAVGSGLNDLPHTVAVGSGLNDLGEASVWNPIDAFMLEKLVAQGLELSPQADRVTLLRRVSFDLIGLPPEPDEVEAFLADSDPRAYEDLVDRLLASPHYGERWGRHWLDVAGYADSEGAQNEDRIRPDMYRYRDYVIRAFNADKPYDRFLHEQLAGDELADYEHAAEITPEIYDNLVATGFLRTVPDRTFADITNFVPDRLEVIADEIHVFSSAVLGLTVQCCRCHSHKFDPIPQRDYYRLAAIFKDAYDEHDWLKSQGPRTLPHVETAERRAWEQHEQTLNRELEPLRKQLAAETDDQKKKPIDERIKSLETQRKPEPRIQALWSRGEPSPTYVLKRGDYLTPGPLVGPDVPSVLTDGQTPFEVQPPWPGAKSTGRRRALARWLTQPDQPLTARVMVNRIWKHHFGRGIVETLENFGKTGAAPTHPELLDWLATEFVRTGWSVKAMQRLIVTSATYRLSSQVTPDHQRLDPENRWLSRMPLKRMEAEVLRDSLLCVAGQLDPTPFGPADAVDVRGDGLVTSKRGPAGWRRSIYVLQRRTQIPTILESFDFPQMGPNCIQRGESVVAPQALHLLNNSLVHQLAGDFADRVLAEVGGDPAAQVDRVYLTALGRHPSDEERALALQTLEELTQRWIEAGGGKESASVANESARRRALSNYCHAILNSAAFVYID